MWQLPDSALQVVAAKELSLIADARDHLRWYTENKAAALDLQTPDGTRRYTRYVGPRIDRILAGPGDTVRWSHWQLIVNGHPSPFGPLNPAAVPRPFTVTVPKNTYLILPSATPYIGPAMDANTLLNMSLIPANQIQGTVYLLSNPLHRLRWMN